MKRQSRAATGSQGSRVGLLTPLGLGALLPPLGIGALLPPLGIGALLPPLGIGALLPPLGIGALLPPLGIGALLPPLGIGGSADVGVAFERHESMYDVAVVSVLLTVVAGGTVAAWLLAGQDSSSSAFALGAFLLVVTLWSTTHLGTLVAETRQWLLLFTQFSYVGVVATPVTWFVFALQYTDRSDWLSWRRLGLLSVVPATVLCMVFTVPFHSLFYTSMSVGTVAGHSVLETTAGPFHVVNVIYSYGLLLAGTGLLATRAVSDSRLYRRQSVVLIVFMTVPWVVNLSYHLDVRPFPWFDATPMAFIATGIPLAVIVSRTDLASFLPVAHERVFRSLDDPILVVSPDGTIIDANDAARTVFEGYEPLEGHAATVVLPCALLEDSALDTDSDGPIECSLTHDGRTRRYLARRQPVETDARNVDRGTLVILTDITARIERERELEELSKRTRHKNEQLERMAGVISHDMAAPLSTAEKTLSLLRADLEDPDPPVAQSLDDLDTVHDRLRGFAEHLPRLARESVDVTTTEACDLATVAQAAWNTVDTGELELTIADSRTLHADRQRLQQVFENLFRNTVEHGVADRGTASDEPEELDEPGTRGDLARTAQVEQTAATEATTATTVRVGTWEDGVFVEDDGPGIGPAQREHVFEYGMSTGDGSGFGLAIVRTIVEAHGWEIAVTDRPAGGARFEITVDDWLDEP